MAKERGQKSNREIRKPKSEKAKPVAQASPFERTPGASNPKKGAAGKKGR